MGVRLNVDGKVGRAPARIVIFTPLLTSWLEYHPDNPKAPLWTVLNKKEVTRLKYQRAREIIKRSAKRAGIKRRI
ncbi:MAG: hypothetical protein ACTSRW_16905 [Candidatus Helarchaeota archaeon]